tara:strand:+ start:1128 stop:2249 length:1122 start_codon:yes stop_codon:yes gene_type:complete
MAYNVLDGAVDYSTTQHTEIIDAHANQEIKGTKTIIGTLLAKDGRAIVPPAITKVEGSVKNAVITHQHDTVAKANINLTFDGKTLVTKDIQAATIAANGAKLTNLPANQFNGKIPARFLQLGRGLKNVRNKVQVDPAEGIKVDEGGVTIALSPKRGLNFKNSHIMVDPKNCAKITLDGQNLSDDDIVMVHDTSRGDIRNTTLANLYNGYINAKLPQSVGPLNSLQLRAKQGFNASANLTFNPQSNVLNVDGTVVADGLVVSGRTHFEGVVTQNIKSVDTPTYEVDECDYTVLADTSDYAVKVVLPPACDYPGRVLNIKKINSRKYQLQSHLLTIQVEEGEIDFKDKIEVKFTYSTLMLQSDGQKWWVIGKTGS